MSSPLVSIIMPAYNAQSFIAESINSVRLQNFKDWELLVIEDASTDNTLEIIKGFQQEDSRIKMYPLPVNQGSGFARNVGIKAAQGHYIAFLDADDLWERSKLQEQLQFMKKTNSSVCYSSYELINEKGERMFEMVLALKSLNFKKLLTANYIGNLTGIYHSKKLGKVYCPPIRKRQDWAMWLEVLKRAGGATGITHSLAKYRVRKGSISGNKLEMLHYNYKIYRKVLGFPVIKSCALFCNFLAHQFFVKSKQNVILKQ